MNIRRQLLKIVLPPPVPEVDGRYTMMLPADPSRDRVTDRLVELALRASTRAAGLRLDDIERREGCRNKGLNLWPGEHYRLLAAMVAELDASRIVEIGTFQGLSALAMLSSLKAGGSLVTFDVVPWRDVRPVLLRDGDFEDGRLRQEIADLSDFTVMKRHADVLQAAEFFFIDAAKDGVMERKFLENFRRLGLPKKPILMFDDTKTWKMIRIWHDIQEPKLDVTSFGHWAGSGLVDWPAAT